MLREGQESEQEKKSGRAWLDSKPRGADYIS